MYGTLVIAYLFLGGAAGGAFLVTAVWSLALHRRPLGRSHALRREFRVLRGRSYAIAALALASSMLCLLWDLDYPERALLIFTSARPTVLTFGACALSALLGVGTLLALANLLHLRIFSGRIKHILDSACALLAAAVMGYTGVFLYSNIGIAFWHSLALIGLFFCSALSSGLSLVMLIDYFSRGEAPHVNAVRSLQKWHLACLATELVFLAIFLLAARANPAAAPSLALLLSDAIFPTSLIGVLGFGIALPFALETYALLRKEQRSLPVSDFVCLIGALCLRWTVIVCGVH